MEHLCHFFHPQEAMDSQRNIIIHGDMHDHTVRPKPGSSNSQLRAPTAGTWRCPLPTALSPTPQTHFPKEWEVG